MKASSCSRPRRRGRSRRRGLLLVGSGCSLVASGGKDDERRDTTPSAPAGSNDPSDPRVEVMPDPLEGLPRGADSSQAVCARGQQDKVTKALCGSPTITSVAELQEALGLGFTGSLGPGAERQPRQPGLRAARSFELARHARGLRDQPAAFVFSPPPGSHAHPRLRRHGLRARRAVRRDRRRGPNRRTLSFYLLKFELACEADKSCKPGDLLTPAVEKNWKGWTLYQDEDLKNTIADCRQCHQPDVTLKPMLATAVYQKRQRRLSINSGNIA